MPVDDALFSENGFITAAVGLGLTIIIVLLMVLVGGLFAGVAIDSTYQEGLTDLAEFDEEGVAVLSDTGGNLGAIEVVHETRLTAGNAVAFVGEHERYVAADIDENWHEGDWSVLVSANLSDEANPVGAYSAFSSADDSVIVQYQNGSWLAYTENALGEDAVVTVDAEQGEWQHVIATFDDNANELAIYVGAESNMTALDFADADRMLAADWRGEMDEIRVVEETVSATDVSRYDGDPVRVLDAEDDSVARLMFNEGEGDTTRVYWADTDAELVGIEWIDSPFDGPELTEGNDFDIRSSAGELVAVDGGEADGAPVIWARYDGGADSSILTATGHGDTAFTLIAIGILLIPVAAVLVFLFLTVDIGGIGLQMGGRKR